MSDGDPLSDLQAALEQRGRVGAGSRTRGTLSYRKAAPASGMGARILLHLLGWLYILFGLLSIAAGIYLITRPLPITSGALARTFYLACTVVFVAGALYLVTGIIYVACAFTLNRSLAGVVYVLSIVWIVLFMGHAGFAVWKISPTFMPEQVVSAGIKIAIDLALIAATVGMLFALSSAMGKRRLRRR